MTNATTMLSLIPVLWATGRGSELMQPMVLNCGEAMEQMPELIW